MTIIHTAGRRQNTSALTSDIVEKSDLSSLIDYIQLLQSEEQT